MYPKAHARVVFEVLLILILPFSAVAAPTQPTRLLPDRTSATLIQSPSTDLSRLSQLISESKLYEQILNNPDFIKIQSIAQRWWDNQTGAKHKQRVAQLNKLPNELE